MNLGISYPIGFAYLYGRGHEGALSVSSGTTTLQGEHFYTTVTVSGGTLRGDVRINGNSETRYVLIRARDYIEITGGTVHCDGTSGGGPAGGAGGIPGGPGSNGTAGNVGYTFSGGSGGNGGLSSGASAQGLGGAAGGQVTPTGDMISSMYRGIVAGDFQRVWDFWQSVGGTRVGATGGGGGGGAGAGVEGSGGSGGAAGTGGGLLLLVAPRIKINAGAVVSANGGNGANGTGGSPGAGGSGGGGGGGGAGTGGLVIFVSEVLERSGTVSVTGGTGGNGGVGGGSGATDGGNGASGANGVALHVNPRTGVVTVL